VVEAEPALPSRLVQVGFMRRYDDGYRAVKQALDAGQVGVPLLIHCAHRNASVAGLGAGFSSDMLMTDSAVHEIDVTRWLLASEITAVSVVSPRPTPRAAQGLKDPQLVLFETAAGVVVDVEVFVNCQYGYDIRCEVVGESGTLSLPAPAGAALRQDGQEAVPVPADFRVRFGQAYQTELQEWVDGALRGEVTGPNAWDGYATTAVAVRGIEALEQGGRLEVELAERPAFYG
jgi:myo-inositol 2-dehydrogenase/D-chiro-inositol 1-dehydrogenase